MSGGYGPAFVVALLKEIDEAVGALDAVMVEGHPQSWDAYRAVVAERRGLRKARALVVQRCDRETRKALGIKDDPPQPRRAPM